MKELSIEEKAKAYDEALERAKEIMECSKNSDSREVRMVLSFFPELKESEDEKIRKMLIKGAHPATKEQRDLLFQKMHEAGYGWDAEKKELKEIEKKPTWSKEDDEMRDSIIEEVRYIGDFPDYPTKEENELYDECLVKVKWLNSLKDRCTWKPSDEMLEALYRVIPENVMETSEDEMLLDKLYQGLKYGRVLNEN